MRDWATSLIEVLGSRKGRRLLQCMAERMAEHERLAGVPSLHRKADEPLPEARIAAVVWFRQNLPCFVARLE